MLIPHSILPNHTEGHRLKRCDALSRKVGLRLGKVEASPTRTNFVELINTAGFRV